MSISLEDLTPKTKRWLNTVLVKKGLRGILPEDYNLGECLIEIDEKDLVDKNNYDRNK